MSTGRLPDPNTAPVTAKGDLYTYSTVPAKLAVGNNGETLVADSSATTGLRWQGDYAAGKNKIINGDFRINQRGFTSTTASGTFGFDRFFMGAVDGTSTYSAETFTPGAAPVAGYEATNFVRLVSTGQTLSSADTSLRHRIEDVRTLAGQTATVSFFARASTGTPSVALELQQNFGSGGSSAVSTFVGKPAITTSFVRYSFTVAVPSVSGKTIGAGSYLQLNIFTSAGTNFNARTDNLGIQSATIDLWGIQVEAGSVATAFQTATGTLAGELAACLYYFNRIADFSAGGSNGQQMIVTAQNFATTGGYGVLQYPKMRISPTATFSGNADFNATGAGGNNIATTAMAANSIKPNSAEIRYTTAGGLVAGNAALLYTTTTTGKLDLSAEL